MGGFCFLCTEIKMHKLIVLMGGQGSGKGTFCKMLLNNHKFNCIETGAIFRELPSDCEIAKIIARGDLVPDSELFKLIESKLDLNSDNLMDGFPRTLGQAQWLIENYADKFDTRIVYLNVAEEIMLARIQKRINAGGGRADDADAAAVRKRLDSFWKITMPAIDWLRENSKIKFADTDVSGETDENFARVENALR